MRPPVRALAVAAAASLLAPSARADDVDDKRECAAAHEQTQRRRLDGKLLDARASAIACAREVCPSLVRVDCIKFLDAIDAAIPTLLVDIHEPEGEMLPEVMLTIDGSPVDLLRLKGRPVALDPGEHVVRVGATDGRVAEVRVLLVEGEVRRRVVVQIPASPRTATPGASSAVPQAEERANSPAPSRVAWPTYALGGVGLLGLGTFAFFGLRGYREQVSLEASCAPACAPGRDDAMRTDYLVADIGLAVGAIAITGAVWLALRNGRTTPASTR